jgi:hypothetical protein
LITLGYDAVGAGHVRTAYLQVKLISFVHSITSTNMATVKPNLADYNIKGLVNTFMSETSLKIK